MLVFSSAKQEGENVKKFIIHNANWICKLVNYAAILHNFQIKMYEKKEPEKRDCLIEAYNLLVNFRTDIPQYFIQLTVLLALNNETTGLISSLVLKFR